MHHHRSSPRFPRASECLVTARMASVGELDTGRAVRLQCVRLSRVPAALQARSALNPSWLQTWVRALLKNFTTGFPSCNAPLGTLVWPTDAPPAVKRSLRIVLGSASFGWGCGGNMKPGEFATLYRKFVTQFPAFAPRPIFIARRRSRTLTAMGIWVGPQASSRQCAVSRRGGSRSLLADFRNTKVIPEKSPTQEWYAVLREGLRTEAVIRAAFKRYGKVRSCAASHRNS